MQGYLEQGKKIIIRRERDRVRTSLNYHNNPVCITTLYTASVKLLCVREMALASLDRACCSPANSPCSFAPFNTRRTKARVALASRLAVNHCSVELRLQDPPDSARRPSVPTSEDGGEAEDEATDADEDDGRSASNGSPVGDLDSMPGRQINECEILRRQRIGLANKGKIPWNKGKHHSPGIVKLLCCCMNVTYDNEA